MGRFHNQFHRDALKKYHGNDDLLEDPDWDVSDIYIVQEVLDERTTPDGSLEYQVHWEGWDDPKDYTWEPLTNLKIGSEPVEALKQWQKKQRRISALIVKYIH